MSKGLQFLTNNFWSQHPRQSMKRISMELCWEKSTYKNYSSEECMKKNTEKACDCRRKALGTDGSYIWWILYLKSVVKMAKRAMSLVSHNTDIVPYVESHRLRFLMKTSNLLKKNTTGDVFHLLMIRSVWRKENTLHYAPLNQILGQEDYLAGEIDMFQISLPLSPFVSEHLYPSTTFLM